jgi:hypothetical protein
MAASDPKRTFAISLPSCILGSIRHPLLSSSPLGAKKTQPPPSQALPGPGHLGFSCQPCAQGCIGLRACFIYGPDQVVRFLKIPLLQAFSSSRAAALARIARRLPAVLTRACASTEMRARSRSSANTYCSPLGSKPFGPLFRQRDDQAATSSGPAAWPVPVHLLHAG